MANKQSKQSRDKKPGSNTADAKRAARIERNADKKRLRKQNRRIT